MDIENRQAVAAQMQDRDEINNWKNSLKKKEKELEHCRKEKVELSKQLAELRKQIKVIKTGKYEQQMLIEVLRDQNVSLQDEIVRLSKALAEKDKLLDEMNEQNLLMEIKKMENEIKRTRERNSKLLTLQAAYKREIAFLQEKLETMSLIKNDNEHLSESERLKQVNLSLASELNAYKTKLEMSLKELQDLKLAQNVEQLVAVLFAKLTYDTLDHYKKLDRLVGRIRFMRRVVQKKKNKSFHRIATSKKTKENVQLGYLIERDGWFWFVSISTTEMYRVGGNPTILKSDVPVAAVIHDGWANIVKIFEVQEETEETVFENKEPEDRASPYSTVPPTDEEIIQNLEGIKVLIIGSRNLVKYKASLESRGTIVETNNPFEESNEKRRGAFNRADIVIICTGHIPHNVLSPVELTDKKVEMVERDNVRSIVVRVRFAAMRLNINVQ